MTKLRVLIVLAFLFCLFVNVQAQSFECRTEAGFSLDSDNPFSNEIEGFKFFGQGKLRSFKLGVSTIDDARNTFGTPLKVIGFSEFFDYDSDWLIIFSYLTSSVSKTTPFTTSDGVTVMRKYVIRPEYIGRINRIQMFPKRNFQFNKMSYPDKTVKERRGESDSDYTYTDRYGLAYKVVDQEGMRLGGDLKKYNVTLSRGNILEISYTNHCLLNQIYDEQK
jgi:hypothetical protein